MKVTALEPFGAELSEVQIAVAVAAMAASVHDPLARHRVVVFRISAQAMPIWFGSSKCSVR